MNSPLLEESFTPLIAAVVGFAATMAVVRLFRSSISVMPPPPPPSPKILAVKKEIDVICLIDDDDEEEAVVKEEDVAILPPPPPPPPPPLASNRRENEEDEEDDETEPAKENDSASTNRAAHLFNPYKIRKDARRARDLHHHVTVGLKGLPLSDKNSFYTSESGEPSFVNGDDPEPNVRLFVKRIKEIRALMTANFKRVSGCYVGKTSRRRLAERFSAHRKKGTENSCVAMITIATFDSVPEGLKRWGLEPETVALLYEVLVTKACREAGIEEYDAENVAGGGRVGGNTEALLYVLMVVSNE